MTPVSGVAYFILMYIYCQRNFRPCLGNIFQKFFSLPSWLCQNIQDLCEHRHANFRFLKFSIQSWVRFWFITFAHIDSWFHSVTQFQSNCLLPLAYPIYFPVLSTCKSQSRYFELIKVLWHMNISCEFNHSEENVRKKRRFVFIDVL